jgi:hypothetical protein
MSFGKSLPLLENYLCLEANKVLNILLIIWQFDWSGDEKVMKLPKMAKTIKCIFYFLWPL